MRDNGSRPRRAWGFASSERAEAVDAGECRSCVKVVPMRGTKHSNRLYLQTRCRTATCSDVIFPRLYSSTTKRGRSSWPRHERSTRQHRRPCRADVGAEGHRGVEAPQARLYIQYWRGRRRGRCRRRGYPATAAASATAPPAVATAAAAAAVARAAAGVELSRHHHLVVGPVLDTTGRLCRGWRGGQPGRIVPSCRRVPLHAPLM